MNNHFFTLFLVLLLLFTGCSLAPFAKGGPRGFSTATCGDMTAPQQRIYVVNIGWHTGIVIPSDSALERLGWYLDEVHNYRWIEVGWGEQDFYMGSGYSMWAGLKAVLFSDRSVLHVAAFNEEPRGFFADHQVIELSIPEKGYQEILDGIVETLALDSDRQAVPLGKSLYGSGRFYAARGSFSLSNTCNTWTGRLLARAGCPIDPSVTRASALMSQIEGRDDSDIAIRDRVNTIREDGMDGLVVQ